MPCSLRAFALITHSVYGVQCFLTRMWRFLNRNLHATRVEIWRLLLFVVILQRIWRCSVKVNETTSEQPTSSAQTWRSRNLENQRPSHKSLTLIINIKSNYYGKTDYQKVQEQQRQEYRLRQALFCSRCSFGSVSPIINNPLRQSPRDSNLTSVFIYRNPTKLECQLEIITILRKEKVFVLQDTDIHSISSSNN